MNDLTNKILNCKQCSLREGCNNVVPGEGDSDADIMIIGEGPGKNEDLQGRPFIGAAGKFLDELLASIDLKRENVYITNVVKCRPPENRDPLPEEVEACREWLNQQVIVIKPKLIILLGRHAMCRFLPNLKISEAHGRAFRRDVEGLGNHVFFPVYHPAAALYNGSMRPVLLGDFRKIPALVKVVEEEKKQVKSP